MKGYINFIEVLNVNSPGVAEFNDYFESVNINTLDTVEAAALVGSASTDLNLHIYSIENKLIFFSEEKKKIELFELNGILHLDKNHIELKSEDIFDNILWNLNFDYKGLNFIEGMEINIPISQIPELDISFNFIIKDEEDDILLFTLESENNFISFYVSTLNLRIEYNEFEYTLPLEVNTGEINQIAYLIKTNGGIDINLNGTTYSFNLENYSLNEAISALTFGNSDYIIFDLTIKKDEKELINIPFDEESGKTANGHKVLGFERYLLETSKSPWIKSNPYNNLVVNGNIIDAESFKSQSQIIYTIAENTFEESFYQSANNIEYYDIFYRSPGRFEYHIKSTYPVYDNFSETINTTSGYELNGELFDKKGLVDFIEYELNMTIGLVYIEILNKTFSYSSLFELYSKIQLELKGANIQDIYDVHLNSNRLRIYFNAAVEYLISEKNIEENNYYILLNGNRINSSIRYSNIKADLVYDISKIDDVRYGGIGYEIEFRGDDDIWIKNENEILSESILLDISKQIKSIKNTLYIVYSSDVDLSINNQEWSYKSTKGHKNNYQIYLSELREISPREGNITGNNISQSLISSIDTLNFNLKHHFYFDTEIVIGHIENIIRNENLFDSGIFSNEDFYINHTGKTEFSGRILLNDINISEDISEGIGNTDVQAYISIQSRIRNNVYIPNIRRIYTQNENLINYVNYNILNTMKPEIKMPERNKYPFKKLYYQAENACSGIFYEYRIIRINSIPDNWNGLFVINNNRAIVNNNWSSNQIYKVAQQISEMLGDDYLWYGNHIIELRKRGSVQNDIINTDLETEIILDWTWVEVESNETWYTSYFTINPNKNHYQKNVIVDVELSNIQDDVIYIKLFQNDRLVYNKELAISKLESANFEIEINQLHFLNSEKLNITSTVQNADIEILDFYYKGNKFKTSLFKDITYDSTTKPNDNFIKRTTEHLNERGYKGAFILNEEDGKVKFMINKFLIPCFYYDFGINLYNKFTGTGIHTSPHYIHFSPRERCFTDWIDITNQSSYNAKINGINLNGINKITDIKDRLHDKEVYFKGDEMQLSTYVSNFPYDYYKNSSALQFELISNNVVMINSTKLIKGVEYDIPYIRRSNRIQNEASGYEFIMEIQETILNESTNMTFEFYVNEDKIKRLTFVDLEGNTPKILAENISKILNERYGFFAQTVDEKIYIKIHLDVLENELFILMNEKFTLSVSFENKNIKLKKTIFNSGGSRKSYEKRKVITESNLRRIAKEDSYKIFKWKVEEFYKTYNPTSIKMVLPLEPENESLVEKRKGYNLIIIGNNNTYHHIKNKVYNYKNLPHRVTKVGFDSELKEIFENHATVNKIQGRIDLILNPIYLKYLTNINGNDFNTRSLSGFFQGKTMRLETSWINLIRQNKNGHWYDAYPYTLLNQSSTIIENECIDDVIDVISISNTTKSFDLKTKFEIAIDNQNIPERFNFFFFGYSFPINVNISLDDINLIRTDIYNQIISSMNFIPELKMEIIDHELEVNFDASKYENIKEAISSFSYVGEITTDSPMSINIFPKLNIFSNDHHLKLNVSNDLLWKANVPAVKDYYNPDFRREIHNMSYINKKMTAPYLLHNLDMTSLNDVIDADISISDVNMLTFALKINDISNAKSTNLKLYQKRELIYESGYIGSNNSIDSLLKSLSNYVNYHYIKKDSILYLFFESDIAKYEGNDFKIELDNVSFTMLNRGDYYLKPFQPEYDKWISEEHQIIGLKESNLNDSYAIAFQLKNSEVITFLNRKYDKFTVDTLSNEEFLSKVVEYMNYLMGKVNLKEFFRFNHNKDKLIIDIRKDFLRWINNKESLLWGMSKWDSSYGFTWDYPFRLGFINTSDYEKETPIFLKMN